MSIPTQRGRLAAESYLKHSRESGPQSCPYERGTDDYNAWINGWWETIQKTAVEIPTETNDWGK